jgi:hypothetical protein
LSFSKNQNKPPDFWAAVLISPEVRNFGVYESKNGGKYEIAG